MVLTKQLLGAKGVPSTRLGRTAASSPVTRSISLRSNLWPSRAKPTIVGVPHRSTALAFFTNGRQIALNSSKSVRTIDGTLISETFPCSVITPWSPAAYRKTFRPSPIEASTWMIAESLDGWMDGWGGEFNSQSEAPTPSSSWQTILPCFIGMRRKTPSFRAEI